jgi:hypothetical protein
MALEDAELFELAAAVDRAFLGALAALELRPAQLRALRAVAPGAGADADAETLDAIEQRGLLERRRRRVELTASGRALLEEALTATAGVEDDVLSSLSASRRRALDRRLETIWT